MARMYARRRGTSGSVRPYRKETPEWSNTDTAEIEKIIIDLRKDGLSASQIGLVLRDRYAVPDVKLATGKRITEILREKGLESEIPEDLRDLMRKALRMRKHLAENKKTSSTRASSRSRSPRCADWSSTTPSPDGCRKTGPTDRRLLRSCYRADDPCRLTLLLQNSPITC